MCRRLSTVLALACLLAGGTACTKVAELGNKLKAPEQAVPAEPGPGLAAASPAELTIIPPPPEPGSEGPQVNVDAEVSILAYHDFSTTREIGEQVIRPDKFRQQMESLKKSGIAVISMSDFLAWKKGKTSIPSPSVVITIDDGWEGVYSEAFPIFKQYQFPFSIYLYTNYLGGAGRSLSDDQIRDMLAHGCEIGIHSVSHSDMSERHGKSDAGYDAWLRQELGDSIRLLREKFGDKVLPVFAYPYGKYNQRVMEIAREYGYELGVTVWGKKTFHDTPELEVGRYIVHGKDDRNFRYAMMFRGMRATGSGALAVVAVDGGGGKRIPVTVWPKESEIIRSRTPAIVVDVSPLGPVETDSITLDVSGYGRVPVEFDAKSGMISHQVVEPLRGESCQVSLRLKRQGQADIDSLTWSFQLDRAALYLREESGDTAGTYASRASPSGS